MDKVEKKLKDYDIYRDSYLRYVGYSNEVGEAFRPLIRRSWVNASYAMATTYVCADTVDKSYKCYKANGDAKKVAIVAGDVFLWQMIASVILPGLTINRLTWLTGMLLRRAKVKKQLVKVIPSSVGLCSIPLIIHPIDRFCDHLMDVTYRKWIS